MAKSFRTLRRFLAPSWLTTGDGELVGYALDLVKDAFVERVRLGLLAQFPQNGPNGEVAPSDALAAQGRDRRVIRGIDETDAAYALRLLAWLDDRKRTGNPFALLQKLAEYLGTGCVIKTVDVNGNWFVRDASGNLSFYIAQANWNWDGDFSGLNWSRFWVVIHPPSSLWTVSTHNWGDATGPGWGDETGSTTLGTTATVDQVNTVRAIVKDWKPAHTQCVNVIVAFDPATFDPTATLPSAGLPDGTWNHWSKNVGGVQVPARLSTARYWDGV